MKQTYWLWYPGDFEIYQGLLQNFSREERGFDWPAFWYQDDCHKNVKFKRTYELTCETCFTVYSHSCGYVQISGRKYRFGERIVCGPMQVEIEVYAGLVTGLPAVYIEGDEIRSDAGWKVTDFAGNYVRAGYSSRYTQKEQDPSVWVYDTEQAAVAEKTEMKDGVLYDFGRELTAVLQLSFPKGFRPVHLCYGESIAEATDVQLCYYSQKVTGKEDEIRRRAFRYVFVPDCKQGEVEMSAQHQYVDIPVKASFTCEDDELNRIWQASVETFRLCSGVFFIDGIKRDRWIWSGDAFQSYMVNPYLFFDEDINKRTIWALRGADPVRQHINTIVDYSMYWVISVYNHYQMTGDREFVSMIYPRVVSMMAFLEDQLDEHGFLAGRPGDWIFIDWSEMDKDGALCAEQMLLAMCYRTMRTLQELLGKDGDFYRQKYDELMKQIERLYWCGEKQAYIDSFSSGKKHVSRHANIFAILFDLVDADRQQVLYRTVLCNDSITRITTPYFKFYELEVLCKLGKREEVLEQLKSYWGGILKEGAVTIWEEFDPRKQGDEHYAMYGDPYGKSLCHAWGASPVYLLGRYFLGVESTGTAYETFRVAPDTQLFSRFEGVVPVKDGQVCVEWDGTVLAVTSDRSGGTLVWKGREYPLEPGRTVTV